MSAFKDQLGDTTYPWSPGHRGVDTSIAAAESMMPHFNVQQQAIVEFMRGRGFYGATQEEISTGTQLSRQSVCGRMVELCQGMEIVRTERKRTTSSGRGARVYVHKNYQEDQHV